MSIIDAILAAEFGGSSGYGDISRVYPTNPLSNPQPNTVGALYADGNVGVLGSSANYQYATSDVPATGLTSNATQQYGFVPLTSTKALLIYATNGSVAPRAVVVDVTNPSVPVWGTDVAIGAASIVMPTSKARMGNFVRILDSSRVLFVYQTGAAINAVVLTVSGNTVTVGTITTLVASTNSTQQMDVCALDTSKFAVIYKAVTTNYATVVAFNVSGSTITVGSPLTVVATALTYDVAGTEVTTNKVVVGFQSATSNLAFYHITCTSGTGTTLSVSSVFNVSTASATGNMYYLQMYKITTGQVAVFAFNDAAGYVCATFTVNVSGTNPAAGATAWRTFQSVSKSVSYAAPVHAFLANDGQLCFGFVQVTGSSSPYTETLSLATYDSSGVYNNVTQSFNISTGSTTTPNVGEDAVFYTFDPVSKLMTVTGCQASQSGTSVPSLVLVDFTPTTPTQITVNSSVLNTGATASTGAAQLIICLFGNVLVGMTYDTISSKFKMNALKVDSWLLIARYPSAVKVFIHSNGRFYMKGLLTGLTSLITGQPYYYNNTTGALQTTSSGGTLLGSALSTTEILVKDYI